MKYNINLNQKKDDPYFPYLLSENNIKMLKLNLEFQDLNSKS